MSIYIDTNLIYRYARVLGHQKYDIRKIGKELDRISEVIVTEFSILELYTHNGFSKRQIRKVLKMFLKKKNIRYLSIAPEGFDGIDIGRVIKRSYWSKMFFEDYGSILSRKVVFEARLLSYFIQAINSIFMLILIAIDPVPLSLAELGSFSANALIIALSFKERIAFQLIGLVDSKYYEMRNDTWFKNKLEDILIPCLEETATAYFAIKNGLDYNQLSLGQRATIKAQFPTNQLTARLHQRILNGNGTIFDRVQIPIYTTIYPQFETEMAQSIPIGVVKYFGILIKKTLFEGRKMMKNDMIDSQFLTIYPNDELLSIDERYIAIIEEFDVAYANRMKAFNASVKK
jgi:hypothetical protein